MGFVNDDGLDLYPLRSVLKFDEFFKEVLKVLLFENLLFLFSITTAFFPCDFARSILLIDFLRFPDNVNIVLFFSIVHLSIFIDFISCRHY